MRLTDRREFPAKVIGFDPRSDVAVIKIEAMEKPADRTSMGDPSSAPRPGEWVLAIGSPFGLGQQRNSRHRERHWFRAGNNVAYEPQAVEDGGFAVCPPCENDLSPVGGDAEATHISIIGVGDLALAVGAAAANQPDIVVADVGKRALMPAPEPMPTVEMIRGDKRAQEVVK